MVEMRFARDGIVGQLVGVFGGIGTELVGEAVGCLLRVHGVVCVDA